MFLSFSAVTTFEDQSMSGKTSGYLRKRQSRQRAAFFLTKDEGLWLWARVVAMNSTQQKSYDVSNGKISRVKESAMSLLAIFAIAWRASEQLSSLEFCKSFRIVFMISRMNSSLSATRSVTAMYPYRKRWVMFRFLVNRQPPHKTLFGINIRCDQVHSLQVSTVDVVAQNVHESELADVFFLLVSIEVRIFELCANVCKLLVNALDLLLAGATCCCSLGPRRCMHFCNVQFLRSVINVLSPRIAFLLLASVVLWKLHNNNSPFWRVSNRRRF